LFAVLGDYFTLCLVALFDKFIGFQKAFCLLNDLQNVDRYIVYDYMYLKWVITSFYKLICKLSGQSQSKWKNEKQNIDRYIYVVNPN